MPAVIRGSAKTRRAAARGGGRGRAAEAIYTPGKLGRGGAVGFDARMAVWTAGGVVIVATVAALAMGGLKRHAPAQTHPGPGLVGRIETAMGFRVAHLTIQGAQPYATPAIAARTELSPGDPILGVNLETLRERVEMVGWVKSAKVRRVLPDTLVIAVKPRTLLAVWQHGDQTQVVDADGQVIPEAVAGGFPDLPLIVGEGANEAAAAILPLVQARPRLMARLDALQRVDGRRWRLRLKDGGVIDMPARGEDAALLQFDQLDARSHLLEVGFARVDLRDPAMTEVTPRGAVPSAPGALAVASPLGSAPATGAVTGSALGL